jgi:hypothetical protein
MGIFSTARYDIYDALRRIAIAKWVFPPSLGFQHLAHCDPVPIP